MAVQLAGAHCIIIDDGLGVGHEGHRVQEHQRGQLLHQHGLHEDARRSDAAGPSPQRHCRKHGNGERPIKRGSRGACARVLRPDHLQPERAYSLHLLDLFYILFCKPIFVMLHTPYLH